VGHARGEGRVDGVQGNRHIHGSLQGRPGTPCPGAHVDNRDPEATGLLALVTGHRPDPDLRKSVRKAFFQDAGEGTRVREPVALKLVVQVGMGVDVQDVKRRPGRPQASEDRIGDGVVAAEGDRDSVLGGQLAGGVLDPRLRGSVLGQRSFAGVLEDARRAEVDHRLAPTVPGG
jgi:hypothetical protein